MNITRLKLAILAFLLVNLDAGAQTAVRLQFQRTGTNAASTTVNIVDQDGTAIAGAHAKLTSSHNFKASGGNVTSGILCPNVNATTSPNIKLTFTITGLPESFTYNTAALDIHALNGGSTYQNNNDGKDRQWNVKVQQGADASSLTDYVSFTNIDIAAGVGEAGNVHKLWSKTTADTHTATNPLIICLTITKGSTNAGCFFGLSEVVLSNGEFKDPNNPGSGDNEPHIPAEHSTFAKSAQIYFVPCTAVGSNYVTSLTAGELTYQATSSPTKAYTLYVASKGEVAKGKEMELQVSFDAALLEGVKALACFDWNRDGVFETIHELPTTQSATLSLPVPPTALEGRTRMRIRLDESEVDNPDADAIGQVLDFVLNVKDNTPTAVTLPKSDTEDNAMMVTIHDGQLRVTGNNTVRQLRCFALDGTLVASAPESYLNVSHLPVGAYILSAESAEGTKSVKIMLE